MRKTNMDTKKLLVSFLTVMSVLLLVATVSATDELVDINHLKVDGLTITSGGSEDVSVIAGETLVVEVFFEALEDASNVRVDAQLEGEKVDADADRLVGDVEEGKRYREVLTFQIPYELDDQVSDDLKLDLKIFNSDFKTELEDSFGEIILRVQRPTFNAAVMLIQTSSTISSGETMVVDVVLKNIGYNDLDDTYVTVRVPALGLEQTDFFGDIIAVECDDDFTNEENYGVDVNRKCDEDDDDTARGRIYLGVPHNTETGIYTLEVQAKNDDVNVLQTKQIFVNNEVPDTVLKSGNSLIVINPTSNVKVYTIIPENPATVSESVVVVPAGSSRTVLVTPNTSGNVAVNVLSGNDLVGTVEFAGALKGDSSTNAVVVLTIVLGIIFIVLVIVLLVLLTRKPEKEEEFGESYY